MKITDGGVNLFAPDQAWISPQVIHKVIDIAQIHGVGPTELIDLCLFSMIADGSATRYAQELAKQKATQHDAAQV